MTLSDESRFAKKFQEKEKAYARKQRDYLLDLPRLGHRYALDAETSLITDNRYAFARRGPRRVKQHPRSTSAKRRKVWTQKLGDYFAGLPLTLNIPLAGRPDKKELERRPSKEVWCAAKAANAQDMLEEAAGRRRSNRLDSDTVPGSTAAATRTSRAPQKPKDDMKNANGDNEQEDSFYNRPSIKLVMPDHLKALLVDDWENVTKNQQLVPLPHPHPVSEILADYMTYEKPKRQEGSASMDILEETVAGLREYFEKCVGRILLYRYVLSPSMT